MRFSILLVLWADTLADDSYVHEVVSTTSPLESHDNSSASAQHHGKPSLCEPLNDSHGNWTGSLEPGSVNVLTCNPGYEVDGKTRVNMTCSEDAEWPAKPWCENVDDCETLVYGCGPAGLCKDLVGRAECICEHDAIRKTTTNGEVVCYFPGDQTDCGGRNCGAHGVCIDLNHYQNTFDTGSSSFRCSCERGYHDDGETCVRIDCGSKNDPLGTWSGSSAYLGEYTLDCVEGAFVWGGQEQALTISCPATGIWLSEPRCQSPAKDRDRLFKERVKFWCNASASLLCILTAALASGLTLGLVSLEPREMEIIQAARLEDCSSEKEREKLQKQKDAARRILPLLKDHHLLLVTLLLMTAIANEALPIFLDDLVSPLMAVLLSVTFVLICGEIIPSAIFTGPSQLTVASAFIPCVNCLIWTLFCVAKPIARQLDKILAHSDDLHTRPELKALLRLHAPGGADLLHDPIGCSRQNSLASMSEGGNAMQSASQAGLLFEAEQDSHKSIDIGHNDQQGHALDDLEVELCLTILGLGEALVVDSPGFLTLRMCSRKAFPAVASRTWLEVASEAVAASADIVVVFSSSEIVDWPVDVRTDEIIGVLRVAELLAAKPQATLGRLCTPRHKPATLLAHLTVADALTMIAESCCTPCGFGVTLRNSEFFGILDGEEALMKPHHGPSNSSPSSPSASPVKPHRRKLSGIGVGMAVADSSPASNASIPSNEGAKSVGRMLAEIAAADTQEDDEVAGFGQPRITSSTSLPSPSHRGLPLESGK
eukprot:TRINITY_DN12192_c0_g1_i1.p1 TRINITY_DN12192_c0_g1~~TRINITY_DN12192_c0_g1_i1.p1  ORF type:complete len:769 (+),score=104.64 TRINITY_DN12192_c0_g1_i1:100-2406(+)